MRRERERDEWLRGMKWSGALFAAAAWFALRPYTMREKRERGECV